jgi:hypothetical protein
LITEVLQCKGLSSPIFLCISNFSC